MHKTVKTAEMSAERTLLNTRSRSCDSLKPQMVFELFELVDLLRVRPKLSKQYSRGKTCIFITPSTADETLFMNFLEKFNKSTIYFGSSCFL